MDMAALSALVYRDNVKQKHNARERLQLELSGKKNEEHLARAQPATSRNALETSFEPDPVSEVILNRLLTAPLFSSLVHDFFWSKFQRSDNFVSLGKPTKLCFDYVVGNVNWQQFTR